MDDFSIEMLLIPLFKFSSFFIILFITFSLRSGAFILIFFCEFIAFLYFSLKGMLKISPFKSKMLNKFFSLKNKNALEIFIIEITSFKLFLKKILLLLIFIFFFENLFSLSL